VRVKLLCVAGGRPNFPKLAPLLRALSARAERFAARLVHTGQHYDPGLSQIFFAELGIEPPVVNLAVGSASHAQQTAELMRRFETVLSVEQPHGVVVVGDLNSALACALTAAKFQREQPFTFRGQPRRRPVVVHVEAGLRSFDDDMPEEINRRVTDSLSDLLLVSEPAGMANLSGEGVAAERCFLVGNLMIDTLLAMKERALGSDILTRLALEPGRYGLLTLHRPSNVDDTEHLRGLLATLDVVAGDLPLVFPVHPRTRARLETASPRPARGRWIFSPPLGYLDFVKLEAAANLVFTDSGGVQDETTVLGVPCLTLRENTERPITLTEGTNVLAGTTRERILAAYAAARSDPRAGRVPHLWDGKAAERVVGVLEQAFR
jgi:UDP-N-acetylglucosamine 2-epimerase (non-hydrolysing)